MKPLEKIFWEELAEMVHVEEMLLKALPKMRDAMETEIVRYHYGLQRQIYLFALHRYLQGRMPSYSPEMHLGGAYYVFLRGLDREYPERGIIRTNPDVHSLTQMERLFPRL